MANPQLENGYTRIENSILKAICNSSLSVREIKIMLCIIRYTYGFHEKAHQLSLSFIEEYTGIDRANISRALRKLSECHIITISKGKGITPQTLSLQKDFDKWECCQNDNSCQYDNSSVVKSATVVLSMGTTNKEKSKEKSKKNIYIGDLPEWFGEVLAAYPNKMGKDRISKKHYKELEEAGKEKLLKCIENLNARKERDTWYELPYCSSFFNGKWKDYDFEAEPEPEIQEPETGRRKKQWQ